jgi:hypothetical protein
VSLISAALRALAVVVGIRLITAQDAIRGYAEALRKVLAINVLDAAVNLISVFR